MKKLGIICLIVLLAVCVGLNLPKAKNNLVVNADTNYQPTPPTPSPTAQLWNGTASTLWWTNGTHAGTESDPYEIATAEDLAGLSQITTIYGKHIKLVNDIVLNTYTPNGDISMDDFSNINNGGKPIKWNRMDNTFYGILDGNGKVISGLVSTDGFISNNSGVIKNLTIGYGITGGIVGYNWLGKGALPKPSLPRWKQSSTRTH